jgi:hypothetical protein
MAQERPGAFEAEAAREADRLGRLEARRAQRQEPESLPPVAEEGADSPDRLISNPDSAGMEAHVAGVVASVHSFIH